MINRTVFMLGRCQRTTIFYSQLKLSSSHAGTLTEEERKKLVDRIIRVDHAGEFGADRIYAGQMMILGGTPIGSAIQHMWEQEKEHLRTFEKLLPKYRARPTLLLPFWNLAGLALGTGSALLGKEAAMAATVAVEESIVKHYNDQIRELVDDDPEIHKELLDIISKFRDDEQEHHDTGIEHEAEQAPLFNAMKSTIQAGCTVAIWLSERI